LTIHEKSRITPEPRGVAAQENRARPTGDEGDSTTSTASASPSASQVTLMMAQANQVSR
jgi:hypothetical protein